ncbi:MAG: hypothetical protein KC492_13620 [Myxococcales bacterium]|nr:hypothetical protein [Myxococcales bacterium]
MSEAVKPARDRARHALSYVRSVFDRYPEDDVLSAIDELDGEASAKVAFGFESAVESLREVVLPKMREGGR